MAKRPLEDEWFPHGRQLKTVVFTRQSATSGYVGGSQCRRVAGGAGLRAGRRLRPGLDLPVDWTPSAHDQVDPGLAKEAVAGRRVVVRAARRGWRTQTLILFTTLTDAAAYPPARLLSLYGQRWQVELDLRTLQATLGLGQLEVTSADLAHKEFYAGLLAYNLVRGLMGVADRAHVIPSSLFANSRQSRPKPVRNTSTVNQKLPIPVNWRLQGPQTQRGKITHSACYFHQSNELGAKLLALTNDSPSGTTVARKSFRNRVDTKTRRSVKCCATRTPVKNKHTS